MNPSMPVAVHPDDPKIINDKIHKCLMIYKCLIGCLIFISIAFVVYLLLLDLFCTLNGKVKDLKVLEIDSLTASNFNLSSRPNQISADWNVQMSFKTMNKLGYFKFLNTNVSVYYDDKRIALKEFRTFVLSSKHRPMHFGGEFSGSSGDIDDSVIRNVSRGIRAGTVRFNIVFEASVQKAFLKGHLEEWIGNRVGYCENVEMFFGLPNSSKARMLNGPQECKLYEYKPLVRYYHRDAYPLCFCTSGGGRICV